MDYLPFILVQKFCPVHRHHHLGNMRLPCLVFWQCSDHISQSTHFCHGITFCRYMNNLHTEIYFKMTIRMFKLKSYFLHTSCSCLLCTRCLSFPNKNGHKAYKPACWQAGDQWPQRLLQRETVYFIPALYPLTCLLYTSDAAD